MKQGLLIQHDSSYTRQRWHGCLIGYAILAISLFIKMYLAPLLPKIESTKITSSKERNHQDRPLTEREDELRSLWAEILHTAPETVGIQHDFFNSGGDSLKAMALVSAARRRGINFSVAQLYQLRNIAELTKHAGEEAIEDPQVPSFSLTGIADVRQLRAVAAQQCDVDIELVQDMLPILDMQGFYLNRQRRQPCSWQVPLAFDLPLDIDMGRLQRAWEERLAHHPITRTRFIDTSYGTFQVILNHETIQWRSETSLAALLAAWESEDMGFRHRTHQSALLKANGQTPGRLMWYVNHAIVDQIMNEHIAQELSTLYEGQTVSLPKRRPFKSVVNHRRCSNRLRSQTFWRSHLKGAKYTTLFEGARDTKSVACSKMTREAGIKISKWLKISEYSIPVTAWAIAFARFAGVEDIPFFMIRAGRTSTLPGSEDVMGPLLTRAPLRVSVKRDAPIVDLVRRVSCDIEESGNHELVREDEFRSVCGEAAEHLASGIYINFVPPSSGFTLSPDALFPVAEDVRDGLGYQTLPIFS
ncbi:hypothetical protein HO173_000848 [Letharia columbiana]|uniref:Carrier domain-containing protein n=1 Tax=Letharia columbiana TaxID=112416 RepID=A0A8H6LA10_9LECA|nr:uncharacterized protein HO173_000848 [Letharia columbiana]KAF6241054.1 hypothetical protein HO173_000848 [Letharia columbiana]